MRVGTYEAPEAAKHFVRLFTTGTLHVAAGRYLQLNSPLVGASRWSKPWAAWFMPCRFLDWKQTLRP